MAKAATEAAAEAARRDGWHNTITQLGRARDKRMATRITTPGTSGSRDEYDDMFHGDDTSATIAELPAREMTREWITLSMDDAGTDVRTEAPEDRMLAAKNVMQALDDLEAKTMVCQAILWARVHGGSLLYLGVNDGTDDLSQPLNMDSIKSIDFLLLFDRWEVQIQQANSDLTSRDFGKPELYLVQTMTESGLGHGATTLVHASRFIRFDGVATSRYRMALNGGWCDSVYTRMMETLRDYGISWHGVAHLLTDFSQAVLKLRGLADSLLQSESTYVLDRMTAFDTCRSVARAIPIDAEDEDFMRVATPMTGLPETLDRLMLRVASAARMPATLLFGQSPAGLNATGESDIRLFYDGIKAAQEDSLRPRIDRLLEIIFAAREGPTGGKEPAHWSYEFNPLWQETDSERAAVRKTQAETDAIYLQEGVLDREEVAMSRFGGDTYSTETVLDMAARLAVPDMDAAATTTMAVGEVSQAVEPEKTLNGAQVTALVEVVKSVGYGDLPKAAAAEIILASFPVDEARVRRMLAPVVEGATRPAEPAAPFTQDSYRVDRIEQRGGRYVVLSMAGDIVASHQTEEEALAHLRAIEAAKAKRGQ